ncbi:MAG TPA: glycosyltransferase family 1 protein [Thermotogaceae bacterium]|nr:glycosyltransferase family 1 protein [Thermotogaceae bacterium]
MKILQITQRFNPSISGSQYHVYRISKELIRLGHEVTVLTTMSMHNKDIRGFSTSRPFTLKSINPALPKFEHMEGMKVYRFKPIFQFWMHMSNPSMFIFLLKHIHKYDVVHGHVYMGAESNMAAKVCRLRKIPFIFTAHDLLSTQREAIIVLLKDLYDKIEGRFTLNTAKKLIALTSENKKQYESLNISEDKIRIIPNGVDYEKFDNLTKSKKLLKNIGSPEKVVLFVARLVKYKGAQHIIKAIPEINNDYPDIKFVFIGEDQGYKKELVQLAKNLDVFDKCIFTGKVDEKDLLKYYSIADVFILPSIGEGFGLVALEAIASGIPVILADAGGLKHILSEIGGYPIDMAKDIPKQIVENVKNIFSDPSIDSEIERGKEVLKRYYTWGRVAKMIERVYKEVIS